MRSARRVYALHARHARPAPARSGPGCYVEFVIANTLVSLDNALHPEFMIQFVFFRDVFEHFHADPPAAHQNVAREHVHDRCLAVRRVVSLRRDIHQVKRTDMRIGHIEARNACKNREFPDGRSDHPFECVDNRFTCQANRRFFEQGADLRRRDATMASDNVGTAYRWAMMATCVSPRSNMRSTTSHQYGSVGRWRLCLAIASSTS